ncbi:FMN-dependent NADH-azoreductase [bioreactor metagenome]|uniref:FMN-dependent NADH-azoreductase n=1 Tax=bioreactor metagenome TaxID=1076179 RepID=A0A645GPE7_9ZZZZ
MDLMKVLFINCCVRGERSRTLRLCKAHLKAIMSKYPDCEITELYLPDQILVPLDEQSLKLRDTLIARGEWDHPIFRFARQLAEADHILIGAPHWNMSFPALLKIYIEQCYVYGVVVRNTEAGSVGLCQADKLIYITTAGDALPEIDFGAQYLKAVFQTFGVRCFEIYSADALDQDDADVEAALARAEAEIEHSI